MLRRKTIRITVVVLCLFAVFLMLLYRTRAVRKNSRTLTTKVLYTTNLPSLRSGSNTTNIDSVHSGRAKSLGVHGDTVMDNIMKYQSNITQLDTSGSCIDKSVRASSRCELASSVNVRDFTPDEMVLRNSLLKKWRGMNPGRRLKEVLDRQTRVVRFHQPTLQPHSDHTRLYPVSTTSWDSRIFTQMAYRPEVMPTEMKTIYLPLYVSDVPRGATGFGQKPFIDWQCKVNMCNITTDWQDAYNADLMLLQDLFPHNPLRPYMAGTPPKRAGQIWAVITMESAANTHDPFYSNPFDWAITHSPWSTIQIPYAILYPKDPDVLTLPLVKNYAAGKTGKVVAIISDCNVKNKRLQYARELSKHIPVDIFGKCGMPMPNCGRDVYLLECTKDVVERYKFHLAFENSNCETYITEKYFKHGLGNDVLPIALGARPEYYRQVSPPHSFIHTEQYNSAAHLAAYLHELDRDDNKYNEYFRWKGAWQLMGEGSVFCRICALLHAPPPKTTFIHKFNEWRATERCKTRQDVPVL